MSSTRIAVIGVAGRMGRAIVRAISETEGATLSAGLERVGSSDVGADAGILAGVGAAGVIVKAGAPDRGAADVWIDFSSPAASVANAKAAVSAGAAMVIGTTGVSAGDRDAITTAAKSVPIVMAPNMSVGVNVLLKLVADAARTLGDSYDIEIIEAHHRAKRDAPSGTALRLAEAVAAATKRDLAKTARYARQGEIGPRPAGEIGIQTIRGGDVVGDHTVFFLGSGERIELTHRASSRETFAQGAVRAALWLKGRPPRLYDMGDVLGLV